MHLRSLKIWFVVGCSICLLCPLVSWAQEDAPGWRFGVIPRLWMSAITLPDEDNVSKGTVWIPLFGGTLSVSPSFAPNVSLLVTGFYGTGEGDGVYTEATTVSGTLDGTLDIERTDIEALLRYALQGTGLNVSVGGRYVEVISKFKASSGSQSFKSRSDTEIWLGEIGIGFVRDITEDGRHRMFANMVGSVGNGKTDFKDSENFESSGSSFVFGLDVNLGYQWWMTSFSNIGLRYRSFAIFSDNDFDLTKFISVLGPELSIGFVF